MAEIDAMRVAAVGLGWVTLNRHIPALRNSAQGNLVGVIDHQPGRAETVAASLKLPLAAAAERADGVPWLERVDAVTIGTPPRTHYAIARSYLEAGKHVLIEKPMAMSVSEAEDLRAIAAKSGRVLAVVHNFQFTRSVQRLKAILSKGGLGEIRSIWAAQLSNPLRRLPAWYEQLPLGLFYDESPHFFYMLRALTGCEPEFRAIHVLPDQAGRSTPAKITALLDANGTPVQVDMNFQAPLSEWHIAMLGSGKAAFVDIFRDILVVLPNDRTHLARDILRTAAVGTLSHWTGTIGSGMRLITRRLSYGNDEVVRRFLLACAGESGALEGVSPADGVAVVRMQHRVVDAAG